MNSGLFDAHNHLQDDRLSADLPLVMDRARDAGVVYSSCCGTNEDDWSRVETMAAEYDGVIPSFGLHPRYIAERTGQWLEILETLLQHNPDAGVGEIGLDHAVGDRRDKEQERVMRRQMELACRLKRPVSFHCRRAWEPLLKALDDLPLPSGFVVHSYSGSPELITEFCKRGGYISFSGSLTRSRNRRAQAACVATPEERLLIETDAPDMSPSIGDNPPETNVSNEPANLVHILQALANYRGQPLDRLAERTMRNARLLFRVDS